MPGATLIHWVDGDKGLDYVNPLDLLLIPVGLVVDAAGAPFSMIFETGRRAPPAKVFGLRP